MPQKEYETKTTKPVTRVVPVISRLPTLENLLTMKTDELVKLLMSPDLAKPVNTSLRQHVIKLLQEREGNAFVQRLLGKTTGGK
jgi:hypothetical protein